MVGGKTNTLMKTPKEQKPFHPRDKPVSGDKPMRPFESTRCKREYLRAPSVAPTVSYLKSRLPMRPLGDESALASWMSARGLAKTAGLGK